MEELKDQIINYVIKNSDSKRNGKIIPLKRYQINCMLVVILFPNI